MLRNDPYLNRAASSEGACAELMATVDDLLMLAEVIDAGGFRAASELTGITKSTLSRRIAALEERLKVTVVTRNSRHFAVTEMGKHLYEQGVAIRAATQSALTIAQDSTNEPSGLLRVACPYAVAQWVGDRVALNCAMAYPKLRLSMVSTRGSLDALGELYDIIVHPSFGPLPDSELVARHLATQSYFLVAAPEVAAGRENSAHVGALEGLCAIGWNSHEPDVTWTLEGPDAASVQVRLPVRFAADNLRLVREAALSGLGVARLPLKMCQADLASGALVRLATDWSPPPITIYALYPSRRRLSLAGQAFINMMREALEESNESPAEALSLTLTDADQVC